VAKTGSRMETKVTVKIAPGPASPAQKTAWRRFWAKLIAEPKNKVPPSQGPPKDILTGGTGGTEEDDSHE
jgi:hypothetical protein